jgi:two-component system, NtrC family, sensor kinase
MEWYSRLSLKTKFIVVTSLIVIAICSGLFFFIEGILLSYLQSEMQTQAEEIAEALQDQLAGFYDSQQIQLSAERLLNESGREVSRIMIYRRLGSVMEPFIQAGPPELPANTPLYKTAISRRSPFRYVFQDKQKEYWEFAFPILSGNSVIGLTTITLNFSQYKVLISAVRTGTLLILMVGLIAMLVSLNVYVEVTIRRPLAEIVGAMKDVKRSRFDTRIRPRAQDEIGLLAEDFNTMTLALGEAQDEILRQNRMLEKRVEEAVSELKSRNLELFQAQDELRRASRLATAGQVAAMLAHDLGSPLSSISGHLQLMMEDPSQMPEEKQRIQLLLGQVERLSDTIRNFLNNVTGWETHFSEYNLNALLEHLIELTSPVLSERHIETIIEIDQRLPMIECDEHQLQQLFLNLFTNAIDAMRDGGSLKVSTQYLSIDTPDYAAVALTMPGEQNEGIAVVTVEDTGQGMNPELRKNLFRPFFSTKEFGKGTGLGLAICKEIVKAHGGQISVQSEEGSGTTFTILFPVSQPEHVSHEKAESVGR